MRKLTWGEVLEREFGVLFLIFILALIFFGLFAGVIAVAVGYNKWILIGWIMLSGFISFWGLWCAKNDHAKCPVCTGVTYYQRISKAQLKALECPICAERKRANDFQWLCWSWD